MSLEFPEFMKHEARRKEFFDKKKEYLRRQYLKQAVEVYPEVLAEIDSWVDGGGLGLEEIEKKKQALAESDYRPELKKALADLYNSAEQAAHFDFETIDAMLKDVAFDKDVIDEQSS